LYAVICCESPSDHVDLFSWLMCSLPQLNPLFGPQIPSHIVRVLQREWPPVTGM
uniref:Mediator of RNA polymerase II transcription subunit 23 n=1 Tax=Echinostoma caproni TaxID=27848 RepID=A0A183BH00_9TREM